jgi:hypothetical protein
MQKRLRERVVKLLSMHCMAHRVQLVAKSTKQCMILSSAACTVVAGSHSLQPVAVANPAAPPFTGEYAGTKLQIAGSSHNALC